MYDEAKKKRDSSVHVYLSLGQWDEWEEGRRNCRLQRVSLWRIQSG